MAAPEVTNEFTEDAAYAKASAEFIEAVRLSSSPGEGRVRVSPEEARKLVNADIASAPAGTFPVKALDNIYVDRGEYAAWALAKACEIAQAPDHACTPQEFAHLTVQLEIDINASGRYIAQVEYYKPLLVLRVASMDCDSRTGLRQRYESRVEMASLNSHDVMSALALFKESWELTVADLPPVQVDQVDQVTMLEEFDAQD